jgi:hypothetical protein
VGTSENPSPGQAGKAAPTVRAVDAARILKELGDAWRYPRIHKVKVLKRQKIEAA